jgi:hypothetical protein
MARSNSINSSHHSTSAQAKFAPTCTVCFESLAVHGPYIPQMLKCAHTLCRTCVAFLATSAGTNHSVKCPVCRVETQVGADERTSEVIAHHAIMSILTNQQHSEPIASSQQDEPTQVSLESTGAAKLQCASHLEPCELWCHTCNSAVCNRCCTGQCTSHRVDAAVDVLQGSVVAKLKEASIELRQCKSSLEMALLAVDAVFAGW